MYNLAVVLCSLTVYQFHESALHRFQMEGTEPKAASESIQIVHDT